MNSRVSMSLENSIARDRKITVSEALRLSLRGNPLTGPKSQEVLVRARVQGAAQRALILVLERNKAEWLQDFSRLSGFRFVRWRQDLRHAFHRARFRLESDLDQIALLQGSGKSQHAAGLGNGLQLCARTPSVIQLDDHRD